MAGGSPLRCEGEGTQRRAQVQLPDASDEGGQDLPSFFMHVMPVNLSGFNATVSSPQGQLALHAWES